MPLKRKDDDVNNDKESVSSVSSSTLRASKRSRNSLSTAKGAAALNTSNDLDDTNDSVDAGSVQVAATLPRAAKRSRSSTLNKSQMNSSNEIEDSAPVAHTAPGRKTKAAVAAAPVVASPSIDSNLNLFLEDLFDIFCSYQDENHRYLASIFYMLPSKKVTQTNKKTDPGIFSTKNSRKKLDRKIKMEQLNKTKSK
jgi:hypothetical protein